MKKATTILLFLLAFSSSAFSQNINTSNYLFGDMEPYIAINPTNENNLIGAWMRITGFTQVTIAVSRSTDGGTTWSTPILMPHIVSTFTHADVSIVFSTTGKAFISYIDYSNTLDSGCVMIANSVDNGATWSTPTIAINSAEHSTRPIDRPWLAIDNSGGSYNGRLYLTSKNPEEFSPNHVWFKYSADEGLTWSTLKQIDSIPVGLVPSMGNIAIGADGAINISYLSYDVASSIFLRVLMVKSTDGGSHFNAATVIGNFTTANTINDTLQFSMTLSANPTNASNLIFTYTDGLTGDADIVSRSSNDGGATWSLPLTINDDGLANGVEQDMSWAGFAPNGTYAVAWRDRRNAGTTAVDPFEIHAALSNDGGSTFKPNYNLSSALSPDIPVEKGNDFIGVALGSNYLHVNWSDNRTGNYEIFTNKETLENLTSVASTQAHPLRVKLFPNPVKNFFTIELDHVWNNIQFIIFNQEGKIIQQEARMNCNQFTVDCISLPAGSYFIKISNGAATVEYQFVKN